MEPVDAYCERMGAGLLAEPINFLTNAAFLIAALVIWPRIKEDRAAQLLAIILVTIGISSGLFHSYAVGWTGAADSLSILIFILIYLFVATRRLFSAPIWLAALAVLMFFPYAIALAHGIASVFGPLNGSVAYIPVPILIVAYGLAARRQHPQVARGFFLGACILVVSLTFRTIDDAICTAFPLGTHFMWHILNGVMLGWMILVISRIGPSRS